MNYIGKVLNNVRDFYNDINAATLTGAIDVVVVEQPDGTFTCSPFHVRFGKLGVLRSREKVVDIEVNGEPLDIHMKLGESGEAFFVEEIPFSELEACPAYLACSPIPSEGEQLLLAQFGDGKSPISSPDSPPTEVKKDLPPLSPLHEDRPSETVHQPKTFKAETVGDVKQSEVEFRPIQPQKQDEGETNSGSNGGNDSGPSGQQPISKNARRKKRRKSMHKKKQQQVKKSSPGAGGADDEEETDQHSRSATPPPPTQNLQGASSSADQRDEDIQFDMEDVTETDSRVTATLVTPAPTQCTLHCGGIMLSGSDDSAQLTYSRDCADCARRCSQIGLATVAQVSQDSEVSLRPKPADLHFFSDTEGSPGHSPSGSRAGSPTPQSDSELELQRQSSAAEQTQLEAQLEAELGAGGGKQSWKWGELPSPPPQLARLHSTDQTANEQVEQVSTSEQQQLEKQTQSSRSSVLSGMWSLMRSQNRQRASQEGVYLDDLNVDTLDPEVAALYFPHSYRGGHRTSNTSTNIVEVHNRKPSRPSLTDSGSREEEDAESGKGPSVSQSPHSVEGAIGGPKLLDSDYEDRLPERTLFPDLALSLCGPLDIANPPSESSFDACVVSHDELRSNPSLLEHPALIVRMQGKLHTWREAAPQVLSLLLFQQPLATNQEAPENSTEAKQVAPDSKIDEAGECQTDSQVVPETPDTDQSSPTTNTPSTEPAKAYSWFSWRRSGSTSSKKNEVQESSSSMPAGMMPSGGYRSSDEDELAELTKNQGRKEEIKEGEGYSGSNSSDESETGGAISIPGARLRLFDKGHVMYRKTLRLSSEQIASLLLKEGANEVVFSVTTAYQGTSRCKCHVYRWRYDDKIVISDIDGTITKSDVLGHILPIVGKDWAQSGVAQLFTKIKNNGYRLLYLSARAIGQARVTREYLKSIKQGDLSLPEGPLLLSPTSLISAFHREVIEKKPEEFKISCLRDIQALFPNEFKPFYAGYGNKINDVWAYRAVGIPIFRIFTINHKGELKHELTQTFQSSYSNMSYIVDQMFPPPPEDKSTTEDFNSFNYWRDPVPELDPDLVPPTPTTPQAKGGKTPVKESPSTAGSPTK